MILLVQEHKPEGLPKKVGLTVWVGVFRSYGHLFDGEAM